jgi:putative hydrolase of the HAD superfamily
VGVVVVTEGGRARVEGIAAQLGVAKHIDRVLEGTKRPELYRRVLRLLGSPSRSFMVGDQLDRDVVPAKAAGLETIYFPGGFQPSWGPLAADAQPDHTISSFAEVPRIVLGRQHP